MGYSLQALIGKRDALESHVFAFKRAQVVSMAQGIAMIPLTDELYEEIGSEGGVEPFYKFSQQLEDWAKRISQHTPVAYIEAEYFGGTGEQNAIVWLAGVRILGPTQSESVINEALKLLNVSAADIAGDELDAVGLGNHRDTESWVSQAD